MEGISEGAATVIEDNGCLSQQLLSKEGGWEEEEGWRCNNDACARYNVILRMLNILIIDFETHG